MAAFFCEAAFEGFFGLEELENDAQRKRSEDGLFPGIS